MHVRPAFVLAGVGFLVVLQLLLSNQTFIVITSVSREQINRAKQILQERTVASRGDVERLSGLADVVAGDKSGPEEAGEAGVGEAHPLRDAGKDEEAENVEIVAGNAQSNRQEEGEGGGAEAEAAGKKGKPAVHAHPAPTPKNSGSGKNDRANRNKSKQLASDAKRLASLNKATRVGGEAPGGSKKKVQVVKVIGVRNADGGGAQGLKRTTKTKAPPKAQPITAARTTKQQSAGGSQLDGPKEQAAARAASWFDKRIAQLQYPTGGCDTTHKYARCGLGQSSGCGFGCQIHHLMYCIIAGMATDRTVVLDLEGWSYAETGDCAADEDKWACFFERPSSCTMKDLRLLQGSGVDIIDLSNDRKSQFNTWVPPEITKEIGSFHSRPLLWFVGRVAAWLMRLRPDLKEAYARAKEASGFSHPILGIHARGDDKVQEAEIFFLPDYIRLSPKFKHVYLATDDRRNLDAMSQFTSNITFSMLKAGSTGVVSGVGARYAKGSLVNLLFDVLMLSECDHFIGSDGSNISRLVYELLQTHFAEGVDKGWSINTIVKDHKNAFFWYLY